jgi:UDP-N-acetyl-D-glucosamine dehydrogenase
VFRFEINVYLSPGKEDDSMNALASSSHHKNMLLEKIRNHTAIVGVVGLGYVGLPFAVEKAKVGFRVIGIEQNSYRADKVNDGESYIPDVKSEQLSDLVNQGLIRAVTDFRDVPSMDAIIICVPTPLTKNLTPDLQYVESVTREIAKQLRPGQFISLESTTYPGTTEELMLPILQTSGLAVEEAFFLAHSPERVDPGNQRYSTKNTNKVVGGIGPQSLQVAETFYKQTVDHVVTVSNSKAAEMVKVFENTFRAVNIALVNELLLLCDRMHLNVWEVLDAAFTKPFGIQPFYPGPGVGGHCIPIDPHYLEWKAKELNFNTHFISLAGEINRKMPLFVREKVLRLLNEKGKAASLSKIVAMGVAYKKDSGDYRESPAIEIIRLLLADRADVVYHDPYVPSIEEDGFAMQSHPLTEELLMSSDLVIIMTDHGAIDYEYLVSRANHVLDTRNATKAITNYQERITLL